MELKQTFRLIQSPGQTLLIVPYGIETNEKHFLDMTLFDAFNRTLWN